jgi:hypothetical protein
MPEYVSNDELGKFKGPKPLQEDFSVPVLDEDEGERLWWFRIEGVTTYRERVTIEKQISDMGDLADRGSLNVILGPGNVIKPTRSDVVDACWAAACVRQPGRTPMAWLEMLGEAPGLLWRLRYRAQVCSRVIADMKPDAKGNDAPDPDAPDGDDAAKEALQIDPLDADSPPSA